MKSLMKMTLLVLSICFLGSPSLRASAEDIFRIKIGKDYNRYSNEELRERVWQLERAVEQLLMRIYHLEGKPSQAPAKEWTCRIQSFGKTHRASGSSRGSATAKVLEQCSDASHAVHCKDSDVKCDSD
jgi:hypothetical protein